MERVFEILKDISIVSTLRQSGVLIDMQKFSTHRGMLDELEAHTRSPLARMLNSEEFAAAMGLARSRMLGARIPINSAMHTKWLALHASIEFGRKMLLAQLASYGVHTNKRAHGLMLIMQCCRSWRVAMKMAKLRALGIKVPFYHYTKLQKMLASPTFELAGMILQRRTPEMRRISRDILNKRRANRGRDICSICMGPTTPTYITPCGHAFHILCVLRWFQKKSSCPMCRCEFGPDTMNEETIHWGVISALL